jgi:hypothetical protein
MQRQQFYPKQLIGVTEMLTLQSAAQNGIDDALVSIGAMGIVSGCGLGTVLPYGWSFVIAAGKVVLEDGTIIVIPTAKTVTFSPTVITAPTLDILFYAVFLTPVKTQNTPIITPDGNTINYIEFDDFNVVLVANGPAAGEVPAANTVAGGGFIGVRLGDIIRRSGTQTFIQPSDITLVEADLLPKLSNVAFFNLNAASNTYNGVFSITGSTTAVQLALSGAFTAQTGQVRGAFTAQQIQATSEIIAPSLNSPDGQSSITLDDDIITLQGNVFGTANMECDGVLTASSGVIEGVFNLTKLAVATAAAAAPSPVLTALIPGLTVGINPNSSDFAGFFNFTTGPVAIGPAAQLLTFKFNSPYAPIGGNAAMMCFLSPNNNNSAGLVGALWCQVQNDGTEFFLNTGANTNLAPNTLYAFAYLIVGGPGNS